jgi:Iron-containing redox enzyme
MTTAWSYEEHFSPPKPSNRHPAVDVIEDYISQIDLKSHPLFLAANSNKSALNLWITQELIMTNAFSQIVLEAASSIRNVHIRSILCEIAFGEHGKFRNGLAAKSHPWLLHLLRESVGIKPSEIKPLSPTIDFISRLKSYCSTSLGAIAAIGVGNERMIIPEYTVILESFGNIYPDAEFAPFLNANLDEDIYHAELAYKAASSLIISDDLENEFINVSISSIRSRMTYFDELSILM